MGVIDILKGVYVVEDQLGNKERYETIQLMTATTWYIVPSGSQGLGIVKTGGVCLISRSVGPPWHVGLVD